MASLEEVTVFCSSYFNKIREGGYSSFGHVHKIIISSHKFVSAATDKNRILFSNYFTFIDQIAYNLLIFLQKFSLDFYLKC
jgi:hypothetical protein